MVTEMGQDISVDTHDQAAGLRRWSQQRGGDQQGADAPQDKTLMVVGLPSTASRQRQRVQQVLYDWAEAGQRWVGLPDTWRVVPLDADSPHLSVLARQQSRWALWVEGDEDGFRRAYRTLKRLATAGGPQRLLVLHPGFSSRSGLLNNVQQVAADYFGIELLILEGTTFKQTESS